MQRAHITDATLSLQSENGIYYPKSSLIAMVRVDMESNTQPYDIAENAESDPDDILLLKEDDESHW